ncbi:MAG TPA: carbon-nitrogen hydrolase family protein, partial [Candidatus Latescibacteria bacterium]|nr:carbon-nitrogen hydrolase family protein [Candidatus Latescibacterota bacterium]
MYRIALAALKGPKSVQDGVSKIQDVLDTCRKQKVQIVCFPETYLPGLRGADFTLPEPDQKQQESALKEIGRTCRQASVAAIVGMEWVSDNGLQNRAFVISSAGRILGHQTKNQITPGGESENYVPDGERRVFKV